MTRSEHSHRGTVYGALLNDRATLTRLQAQLNEPPYKAPPQAPILYIKPRNTYADEFSRVGVPADPGEVRVDATIGLVIDKRATRVSRDLAMSHVGGFVIASDLTLPHENYFRPAIRQRCRDQFCPMSAVFPRSELFNVNTAELETTVLSRSGTMSVFHRRRFSTLVRDAATLLADVTDFMTLFPGDVLLLGPGEGSPIARAGDTVTIKVPGLGQLRHTLVAEEEGQNA